MDMDLMIDNMGDPEFTGRTLLRLVLDIEAAVGGNQAGMTPLGRAVMRLAEDAADRDPELARR